MIFLGLELLAAELLDELPRQVGFVGANLRLAAGVDLLEGTDLVGVVHAVDREASVERADEDQLLFSPCHDLRQGDALGLLHRLAEEMVGLLGPGRGNGMPSK